MKIYLKATIIFLFLYFNFQLYSCSNRDKFEDSIESSSKIPSEYLKLLKLKDNCCINKNDSINFIETWVWKYRKPLSFFYIDNKYYLQIYEMDTASNYSIKDVIHETYSNAHSWTYSPYVVDDKTKMEFLYKKSKPAKPKKLFLDLFGVSIQILKKNDSIVYYNFKCVNFSLKFDFKKPMDIYGESRRTRDRETAMEIMFLKRDDKLYMLILSAKDDGIKIKPNSLYNFLYR